jgi:hypothetical protein
MTKNLDQTGRRPPAQPKVRTLAPTGKPKVRTTKLRVSGRDPRSKRR